MFSFSNVPTQSEHAKLIRSTIKKVRNKFTQQASNNIHNGWLNYSSFSLKNEQYFQNNTDRQA